MVERAWPIWDEFEKDLNKLDKQHDIGDLIDEQTIIANLREAEQQVLQSQLPEDRKEKYLKPLYDIYNELQENLEQNRLNNLKEYDEFVKRVQSELDVFFWMMVLHVVQEWDTWQSIWEKYYWDPEAVKLVTAEPYNLPKELIFNKWVLLPRDVVNSELKIKEEYHVHPEESVSQYKETMKKIKEFVWLFDEYIQVLDELNNDYNPLNVNELEVKRKETYQELIDFNYSNLLISSQMIVEPKIREQIIAFIGREFPLTLIDYDEEALRELRLQKDRHIHEVNKMEKMFNDELDTPLYVQIWEFISIFEKRIENYETDSIDFIDNRLFLDFFKSLKADYLESVYSDNPPWLDEITNLADNIKWLIEYIEIINTWGIENIQHEEIGKFLLTSWNIFRILWVRAIQRYGELMKALNHKVLYDPAEDRLWYAEKKLREDPYDITWNETIDEIVSVSLPSTWAWIIDGGIDFGVSAVTLWFAPEMTVEAVKTFIWELSTLDLWEVGELLISYFKDKPKEAYPNLAYTIWYVSLVFALIRSWIQIPNLLRGTNKLSKILVWTVGESKAWEIMKKFWVLTTRVDLKSKKYNLKKIVKSIDAKKLWFKHQIQNEVNYLKSLEKQLKWPWIDDVAKNQLKTDIAVQKANIEFLKTETWKLVSEANNLALQIGEINKLVRQQRIPESEAMKVIQEANNKLEDIRKTWMGIMSMVGSGDDITTLLWTTIKMINATLALQILTQSWLDDFMTWLSKEAKSKEELTKEFEDLKQKEKLHEYDIQNIIVKVIISYIDNKELWDYIDWWLIQKYLEEWSLDETKIALQAQTDKREYEVALHIDGSIKEFMYKYENWVVQDEKGEFVSLSDKLMVREFGVEMRVKNEEWKGRKKY